MEPDHDKTYIKSKKKWNEFKLHEDIIEALRDDNKNRPTKVQERTLSIALYEEKKFNLLIRSMNGSGKTLAFILPILNSLRSGLKCAEDKKVRGKLLENEIFRPQGVVIVQSNLLQEQISKILEIFQSFGKNREVDKLNFNIGKLDKAGHQHGDIIVCMAKSFLNRFSRGNMKLDQCKFLAIDEIDDVFTHDQEALIKLLQILEKQQRTNTICCSATMKGQFLQFYEKHVKDFKKLNLVEEDGDNQQGGNKITLEGVKNYYHTFETGEEQKTKIYNYIIKVIFKQLYNQTDNKKPQVFVFFNSVQEIYDFQKIFDALASDFTSEESDYLKDISKGVLSAKAYKDGKKVDININEKKGIMTKFRNNQTNLLLSTNIIARGIDVRNACFVINVGAPKLSDRDEDIDIDIYLHRVGRTGRHNDKGIALTIGGEKQIDTLVERVQKVFGLKVHKLEGAKQIADQVYKCIDANS